CERYQGRRCRHQQAHWRFLRLRSKPADSHADHHTQHHADAAGLANADYDADDYARPVPDGNADYDAVSDGHPDRDSWPDRTIAYVSNKPGKLLRTGSQGDGIHA